MGIQPGAEDGLEYIISEKLYNTLPTDEKAYWHPLNYEILSGQLRRPGLPGRPVPECQACSWRYRQW